MKLEFTLLLAAAPLLMAQAPPPTPVAVVNAAVSGVVRDKFTGTPVKDYTVSTYINATFGYNSIRMTAETKEVSAKTDATGRYRLSDLPPAPYRLQAQGPEGPVGPGVTRNVTMAGQDLDNIDFKVIVPGTVSGRVVDENNDPQPNMNVNLVSKEYYLGSTGYYFGHGAITNDLGEFTITSITPGHTYYLMADPARRQSSPHAETPLNMKMRRHVARRTWYPSSPDKEGAAPILLRAGEHREGVDIKVAKTPSYCISGVAVTPNGAAEMNVGVEMLSPSSGTSSSGGSFRGSFATNTGADGEFRMCDLSPGNYRLTVRDRDFTADSGFGVQTIAISDQDLVNLRVPASPRASLEAEVVLDGLQPQTPLTVKARVGLRAMFRTQMPGERSNAQVDIPGTAPLTGLIYDDFTVIPGTVNGPGFYVKDVTYGARSVQYEPIHLGSSPDTTIRFVIGQDGGTLSATVTDKNGSPVSEVNVIIMPQGTASEAIMAARIIEGQTNQSGIFTSPTLPPGKYYVVATEDQYDVTPESIDKLWQSHNRYQDVSLEPNGSVQVTLQPINIR